MSSKKTYLEAFLSTPVPDDGFTPKKEFLKNLTKTEELSNKTK